MPGPLSRLLPYALAFVSSLCIMVLELVASRLVARHVGASLTVWTSVIGVILAGICLGNVLGGRLADRAEPRRVLGPLYALGAALTVGCLWVNASVTSIPGVDAMPWDLRMILVITLDFLAPATVLGMISPVVAKIAVEQSSRAGSAIGDVYFLGAVGSIVGTFVAGFWLIYLAPTSTIVTIVAAALALIAASLANGWLTAGLAAVASLFLGLGALESIGGWLATPGLEVGPIRINLLGLIGHAAIALTAVLAWASPGWRRGRDLGKVEIDGGVSIPVTTPSPSAERPKLGDLAALAFVVSLAFMALEMVAGRLVARHLGSSVYSWTSVIGVLLGGLSLGNYLGGKFADRIQGEKQASNLFLAASVIVALIIFAETPPEWLVRNPIGYFFGSEPPTPLVGDGDEWLSQAISMSGYSWWFRVLFWTGVVFFLPAVTMGTVSPVVAKLAVDRARQLGRTGSAIGQVYAWGMVGSIVGTFLTGFLLIDAMGTKGVILGIATMMAISATILGSVWHAAWAGIPLGLCVIAFGAPLMPKGSAPRKFVEKQGVSWGLREKPGDLSPDSTVAYVDESNYYYIKVNNEKTDEGQKRTLVLDNLIHGYIILDRPTQLDYDYEHIYAYVTDRLMKAKAAERKVDLPKVELGTLFLGGGSYTFPRYLQAIYPRTWAEVAEIDPAVTRANHRALGLPMPDRTLPEPEIRDGKEFVEIRGTAIELGDAGSREAETAYLKTLGTLAPAYTRDEATGEGVAVIEGERVAFGPHDDESSREAYLKAIRDWYANSRYTIRTTWGDARQYVVRNQDKRVDIIYGDAFNDFSVPWHLTTREFNENLDRMLTDDGVYMINIIDVYESDPQAARIGPRILMTDRIEAAIDWRWNGERGLKELAEDLTISLLTPELQSAFDAAALNAADGLAADHRALSGAELRRVVGESVPDREPLQVDRDKLAALAVTHLGGARSAEVLSRLNEARDAVLREYGRKEIRNFAPTTVLKVLDGARAAAAAEAGAAARAEAIDRGLARAAEIARAIGDSPPAELTAAIDGQRKAVVDSYDEKTLTALSATVQLGLLDAIKRSIDAESQAVDQGFAPDFVGQKTAQMAREVASVLSGVRSSLADQVRPITHAEAGDRKIAESVADAVAELASDPEAWLDSIADSVERARGLGAFLGAWVNTAKQTFPNVYVFGTDPDRGNGERETFVVVASRKPIDVAELGRRPGDPQFFLGDERNEPNPFNPTDMKALEIRSRGIVLTDDYAPVENLLAPVAETRGD